MAEGGGFARGDKDLGDGTMSWANTIFIQGLPHASLSLLIFSAKCHTIIFTLYSLRLFSAQFKKLEHHASLSGPNGTTHFTL
jgi:hypothetical protein